MSKLRQKLASLKQLAATDVTLDEDTIGVGQKLADGLKFVIEPIYIEGYATEEDINIQMRMTNGDTLDWSRVVENGQVTEHTLKINGQVKQLSNVRTEPFKEVVDAYKQMTGL